MKQLNFQYDYIIIGSGFGGSVSALRLSEKGYKVLVIEKGKWYKSEDFAKTNWNLRKWLWMPALRFFGIMKMSIFRHIVIVSGTGVGGGSLVYANTLPIPKTPFFKTGSWAGLADWQKELNIEDQFEHPQVSIYFGNEKETVKDPYFNGKGPDRTGCEFCGGCMTGCRHNAKNTLDKNYLYLAQQLGAEILAEQEVFDVQSIDNKDGKNGYNVFVTSSTKVFKKKQEFIAKGVIFSGGVLGTIKLLLKLKKKSLSKLSDTLGDGIRTNNETLISVSTLDKNKDFSKGVAIGSLLHTDENSYLEIVRYSAGSGFWKMFHLPLATGNNTFIRLFNMLLNVLKSPLGYLKIYLRSWSKHTVVLLFMQSIDSTLKFKRSIFGYMKSTVSTGIKPTPNIKESIQLTKKYASITNGKPTSFALESLAGIPSTAHILGGAVMGGSSQRGVINKNNEVFNYHNMYVIDGAMISANPGVNPSLSITAIAEHAMSQIPIKAINN